MTTTLLTGTKTFLRHFVTFCDSGDQTEGVTQAGQVFYPELHPQPHTVLVFSEQEGPHINTPFSFFTKEQLLQCLPYLPLEGGRGGFLHREGSQHSFSGLCRDPICISELAPPSSAPPAPWWLSSYSVPSRRPLMLPFPRHQMLLPP